MKILVTGAAGFIGSHLAAALIQAGHEVVGVDSITDYYAPAIKRQNVKDIQAAGCQFVELDLFDSDLQLLVKDINAVFHCAAQPGISSAVPLQTYLRNNVHATHNLLEACKQNSRLQLFVNIATSSIYGKMALGAEDIAAEPISYYGITKLAAEQLVLSAYREGGFPACSLRLFSVYGPRERPDKLYPRLIHSIVDGVPFPLYADSLEHRRSFTYVDDIVKAFLRTLETDKCMGEVINIGTTQSLTTGEAIEIVEGLLGAKANYIEKPRRAGDQKHTAALIDKAQTLLDYHPNTPFEEGIKPVIEWFQKLPDDVRALYTPKI